MRLVMRLSGIIRHAAMALLVLLGTVSLATAQQADEDIHTLQVTDSIYMLVGGGGNSVVQVGRDGILVVDTKLKPYGEKLLAAIREISDAPIRYIINTHYHPDHTGGNAMIRDAGTTIAGGNVSMEIGNASEGAQIIAHENVLMALSAPTGEQAAAEPDAWPTSTFFNNEKKLWFNDEPIIITYRPAAHSGGDVTVFFRNSNIIVTGDIFNTAHMYPVIDVADGGTVNGSLKALNAIIDLMVPVYGQDGGTKAIPGHGRLSNIGDVLNYREMFTVIRDRIADMKKKGMSLKDVKAAKPTYDFDPRYGTDKGFWTTEKFIEAVYETLPGTTAKSGGEK